MTRENQPNGASHIHEYLNPILVDTCLGYVGEPATIYTKVGIRNAVQSYVDHIIGGRDIRIVVEVEIEGDKATLSLVGDPLDIRDFYEILTEMSP